MSWIAPHVSRMRAHPFAKDFSIVLCLFVTAAFVGGVYAATWGGVPRFWQNTTFMQGIMWVCGQGFENPMVKDVPGLESFLNLETDCFDCGEIPQNIRVLPHDTSEMSIEEIDAYHPQPFFHGFVGWQRYHLYLVGAVTLCWTLFGLCWSALTPLNALLYGATAASGYGLFRLGANRVLAVLATLALIVSPIHLEMAPHLRDYAKTPFLLFVLFLSGCLVKFEFSFLRTMALSALAGLACGIGIGFRTDLMIAAPAVVIVLLFFVPGSAVATWGKRLSALVLFLAVFFLSGYPILVAIAQEAGHFCHVTLLGLLQYCDDRLGVAAPLYHLGNPFSDFYIANVAQTFYHRSGEAMPPTTVWNPEYHAATQAYLREYVSVFPADFVTRAHAAVLRILDEMRVNPARPYPWGITNPFLTTCFDARANTIDTATRGGHYAALLALLVIAARNLRWGFGALFLLCFFAGYTALQFSLRHAFHLEVLVLWPHVFLVQVLWNLGRGLFAGKEAANPEPRASAAFPARAPVVRVLVFAAASSLVAWGALAGLRACQHGTARALFEELDSLPRDPLEHAYREDDPTLIEFTALGFGKPVPEGQEGLPVNYAYVVMEFAGNRDVIPVTAQYEADNWEHFDYTRTVTIPAVEGEGPVRLFFPLYYSQDSRFIGMRIPEAAKPYLRACETIPEARTLPLWMTAVLPPNWREMPLHQQFVR